MQRNTHYRGVARPPGSARRPIILSDDTGQGAYVDSDDQQDTEDSDLVDITDEVRTQQAQHASGGRYRYRQAVRNPSLRFSHRETSVYKFGDIDLKPGTCVELREPFGNWEASGAHRATGCEAKFVEIKSIWVSRSDSSVTIRGLPYTRNHNLDGILKSEPNGVSQMLEIDTDDQRPAEDQCQIGFRPQEIFQLRLLIKTNYVLGSNQLRIRKRRPDQGTQKALVCRGKFCVKYCDARARKNNKPTHDRAYIRLREAEADEENRESDKALRFNWRGKTHRGGSYKPSASGQDQQYTCGDTFCSAGGASHGAVMAGLKLVFGVDSDPVACATWRRNFPDAHMCEQDMAKWISQNHAFDWRSHPIDILHLSPPCQGFCPLAYLHAALGRTNEAAQDSIFACEDIIEKIRSRLITLEQTFGLTHPAYEDFLISLIEGFTCKGYSVRWKVVPLVDYGLPQTRKRLIIIGACPGEPLPPWPPATHAQRPTGSQKRFVTEAQALRGLSRRDPLHNVAHAIVRNNPPRDGNMPFSGTITCTGTGKGVISHFSGLREHTLRELACLQGFPASHQFEGNKTQIKKQIGNAFPSCVVKAIYDHLRVWLEQVDGVQRAPPAQAEARRPSAPRTAQPAIARPRGLPAGTQMYTNGDLTEEEALEFALQESRSDSLPAAVIVPSIEEREDSPVSAVGPLMERMSIAPSSHRDESPAEHRWRSQTLGRSASPRPSHRAGAAAPQKRSLDSMHDGDADEVMKEQSPPKRERVAGTGDSNEGSVDARKIPSRLPRFAGNQGSFDAEVEEVAVAQWDMANHDDEQFEELWMF